MAFEKQPPEWAATGIEPPETKKQTGWEVEDRPPAAWLNWFMNSTGESLKELQQKAAETEWVQQQLAEINPELPDASLTTKGVVQLSSVTNGTSESLAATEKAVKAAYDKASAAETPSGAQAKADAAKTAAITAAATDATTKANTAESNAKSYVDAKPWQKTPVTAGQYAINIAGQDLNAERATGWYMGDNMANAPSSEWYWIEIIRHNPVWEVQNAYCFNRNSFYQRIKQNGTWTAWSQDLFQSGVDAKNGIVGAINAMGGSASTNDTWATLASKIGTLSKSGIVQMSTSINKTAADIPYGDSWVPILSFPAGTKFIEFYRPGSDEWAAYTEGNYGSASTSTITQCSVCISDRNGLSFDLLLNHNPIHFVSFMFDLVNKYAVWVEHDGIYRTNPMTIKTIEYPLSFPAGFDTSGPINLQLHINRGPSATTSSAKATLTGKLIYG
ncbi:pyocin knob domain-containing protein [Paenibacillus caui]|uniref:pyocin knob domain-containing protein n=1 Tax=Paenibacillus caui TaxID=2873927 RepID=UPI001CA8FFED|nr:pyocin knob domain-containing protein [Paenibacillus caui]